MKTFILIVLVAGITWFFSTQLGIAWPQIEINPSETETIPSKPPETAPQSYPRLNESPKKTLLPEEPANPLPRGIDIEEIERDVVKMVNAIRFKRDICLLEWDDRLYNLAKMHSQDMSIRGYLFHSPTDAEYAENCWGGEGSAWGAGDIVESWLSSDFHRTWLLCPNLKSIAVGIMVNNGDMYASWTFWRKETKSPDWWYDNGTSPPDWWY